MSTNRLRVLLVSMLAVFAVSAVASGVAQAAPNTQPAYWHFQAALGGNLGGEGTSGVSRLWAAELNVVIVCIRDKAPVTLELTGNDSSSGVKYEGCKGFKAEKNTSGLKQWEQGAVITGCTARSTGEVAGSEKITTKALTSKLVWAKAAPNRVLTKFAPVTSPFVEIVLEGCGALLNNTYPVTGEVLGWVPRFQTAGGPSEEATMGNLLFESLNSVAGVISQRFTEWEVTGGGAGKEGTAELKLGASNKAVLESTEQVELTEVSGKHGLFEAHE